MSTTSLSTKKLTVIAPELSVITGGRPVYLNTSTGETKEGDIINIPLSTRLDYELELDFNFDQVNLAIKGEWAAYMQVQLGNNNWYYGQSIGLAYVAVSESYNSSTYYLRVFGQTSSPYNTEYTRIYFSTVRIAEDKIRIDIPQWTIMLANVGMVNYSYSSDAIMFKHPIAVYQRISDDENMTNGLSTSWFFITNDSGYDGWLSPHYNPSSNFVQIGLSEDMTSRFHLIYNGPDYIGKTSPTQVSYINVDSVPTYDIVLATDVITEKYIYSDEYCDKYIYSIDLTSSYYNPAKYDLRESWDAILNSLIPNGPSCIFPITTLAVSYEAPIQRFVHPRYIENTPFIHLTTKYHISTIDIGIMSVPTTTNYYFAITTAVLTQINEDTVYSASETALASAVYVREIRTERMSDNSGVERWVSHVIFSLDDLGDNPYGKNIGLASSDGKIYLHLDGEYRMSTYPT